MSTIEPVWIPSHDGTLADPYVRNSDAYGPLDPYMPIFSDERDARGWCDAVGAVPAIVPGGFAEAERIALRMGAEVQRT